MTSDRTIGRLSLYRRLLKDAAARGERNIFSHQLAALAGCTPAQVRRDVMAVGYSGSPAHGYEVAGLLESICRFLDPPKPQGVALVGVGNLGRAMLSYFVGRSAHFSVRAAFDTDPQKTNRVIHGCRCHPLSAMYDVVREKDIGVAIIAVPSEEAQEVANLLVSAGVRGLVNFAPVRLCVPEGVYVENVDMSMTLERVAYFASEGKTAVPAGSGKESASHGNNLNG